jgi:hypothetical protein
MLYIVGGRRRQADNRLIGRPVASHQGQLNWSKTSNIINRTSDIIHERGLRHQVDNRLIGTGLYIFRNAVCALNSAVETG